MSEVSQKAMKDSITLRGRSFIIVTEDENKGVEYHIRQGQPCWGELRKYELSHPKRCTQPSVNKPSDLHAPFPDGKPIGLAIGLTNQFHGHSFPKDHVDFILSNESIHRLGIDKTDTLCADNGQTEAVYFDGLNVDPTVLVNFLRTLWGSSDSNINKEYLDAGFTRKESQVLRRFNGDCSLKYGYIAQGYNSVRRVLQSSPHDFSGGTMEQRVDYNRPMQDFIFQTREKRETWGECCEAVGLPKYSPTRTLNMQSVIIPKVREIFRMVEERQDDISRPLHKWATSDGKINNDQEGWVVP